jgi:hypothetical protein
VNGPHAERGHFSLGYWSTTDWAANLTVERLEQLLRIETAAITKHRSLLAWCEGRAAGCATNSPDGGRCCRCVNPSRPAGTRSGG